MGSRKKKHKRRANHYIITISDNPKASTHTKRHPHGFRRLIGVLIGLLVVAVAVMVAKLNYRSALLSGRETSYIAEIDKLTEANKRLTIENELLSDKVKILSETVNQKTVEVEAIEQRSIPSGFPLSVAADIIQKDEEVEVNGEKIYRPVLEFSAPDGTYVLAAADGTVEFVAEEISYGWEVQINHNNGYVTSYRTNTEPKVKAGDEVSRGGLLFEMKAADNDKPAKMAYQMIYEDDYINPTELLEING